MSSNRSAFMSCPIRTVGPQRDVAPLIPLPTRRCGGAGSANASGAGGPFFDPLLAAPPPLCGGACPCSTTPLVYSTRLTGSSLANARGMARLPLSKHDLSQRWSLLLCRRPRHPAARPSGKRRWDSVPSSPRPMLPNMHFPLSPPPLCMSKAQEGTPPWHPKCPGPLSDGALRVSQAKGCG